MCSGDVTVDAGLSSAEAARRLRSDGPNRLPEPVARPAWRQLVKQLTHVLALLLWFAAALAALSGTPTLSVAIIVIIVINALFSFWQEHRADRAAQRLRGLVPRRVRVLRDGSPTTAEVTELVRGDVVLLEPGDRIGADLKVETASDLRLDESLVSGESEPVGRAPGDRLLTGTFVVRGVARATVVAVGSRTSLAAVATLADSATRPPSPLSVQLSGVVRVVGGIAVVTGSLLGIVAMALGLQPADAFLFGVGVTVALVPEGLLPTVTLSLARGAQVMAQRNALVRRLDAVETLGAATYICTDKTGTLTENRMQVVDVVTEAGRVSIVGEGYEPVATTTGPEEAKALLPTIARSAAACVTGRAVQAERWVAEGDPMDAALDCLARRVGLEDSASTVTSRRPYSPESMSSAAVVDDQEVVLGAPEPLLAACDNAGDGWLEELHELTGRGRRVLAVAVRPLATEAGVGGTPRLLGLLALEDPPREGVRAALAQCRGAGIRVAMLTGDHPRTAAAIARETGLLQPGGVVLVGDGLPASDRELSRLLDRPEGAVIARITPADKYRIARALRTRGHVVAMTGDGVNDAPALREADVGVAMGRTGSDVAREAADLVLLDDRFETIVAAIELGRATFRNVRRFLTYHLTDNVAELTPFAVWAATGGQVPLALSVLQVLALDIGTDLLPALALGVEPARRDVLRGRHLGAVVDRALLLRAFAVLGPTEALTSMTAFVAVLVAGGWTWGAVPGAHLLAVASGTAFAVIACGQMANAFACRSTTRPVWRMRPLGNPWLVAAVATELVLLLAFLGLPGLAELLGGAWPAREGWLLALSGAAVLVAVDGASKAWTGPRARHHTEASPT